MVRSAKTSYKEFNTCIIRKTGHYIEHFPTLINTRCTLAA